MERSVAEFSLALAYRNLAVSSNPEHDFMKGDEYTNLALAMYPKDPDNLVFAAVFMSANGHGDEALKIAGGNVNPFHSSYTSVRQ